MVGARQPFGRRDRLPAHALRVGVAPRLAIIVGQVHHVGGKVGRVAVHGQLALAQHDGFLGKRQRFGGTAFGLAHAAEDRGREPLRPRNRVGIGRACKDGAGALRGLARLRVAAARDEDIGERRQHGAEHRVIGRPPVDAFEQRACGRFRLVEPRGADHRVDRRARGFDLAPFAGLHALLRPATRLALSRLTLSLLALARATNLLLPHLRRRVGCDGEQDQRRNRSAQEAGHFC